MSLPWDYSRCHGNETEQCQDCQRRTDPGHPSKQGWMRVDLTEGEVCEYKIKGEKQ